MNALLLIDIQTDFLPGGALAVPEGDAVIAVANRLLRDGKWSLIVATQDWHPKGHQSFASTHPGKKPGDLITLHGLPQILWPDHCVQNTAGAQLAAGLERGRIQHVIQKGTDPTIDSYSGFFDNGHRKATGLAELLKQHSIENVTLIGLATDYCVKATALDSRQLGFDTTVLLEGVRGVNLKPTDCQYAIIEMQAAGVKIS